MGKKNRNDSVLVLENGSYFQGKSFGYDGETAGEVCFNTSMTGYQEILTDPSYTGQIITLTYPMIGNYGISREYAQSGRIQAAGLIVREYVDYPSNFKSEESLAEYLKRERVVAIEGIDTRRLVLTLRSEGAQRGGIFPGGFEKRMLDHVLSIPVMNGRDLASIVTTPHPYEYGEREGRRFRVCVIDYGVKSGILDCLNRAGFIVEVVPATTEFAELKRKNYDCYFLSNGPGDPEPLDYAIRTIRSIFEEGKPLFGICLGHQLIGLAAGKRTYKLKFGHRGGNQPVRDELKGHVEITAQNHGFAVQDSGEVFSNLKISFKNLNDDTIEGFIDPERSIMSVQHHPEASPGPNDSVHLFQDFYRLVESHYGN